MAVPFNTMPLRGQPLPPLNMLKLGMLIQHLARDTPLPGWAYDDYDEPDPNAPTFYEAMLGGDLR